MAGICFFFEPEDVDVWSGKNLDAWHYAACAAGDIDKIHIVNRTNIELSNPDIGRYEFTVSTELPKLEGRVAKIITPFEQEKYSCSLWDWNHSADWYVFGPALGWKSIDSSKLSDKYVQTIYVPQAGSASLHSVHIASVVMMNRYWVVG